MATVRPHSTALKGQRGSRRYNSSKVVARLFLPIFAVLALLVPASAYIRNQRSRGVPYSRTDFENIQFVLHESTAPGLANRDGETVITAESFPVAAILAAMESWNQIESSLAHFADLQSGNLEPRTDGVHVITFADSLQTRSLVGNAVAITTLTSRANGELTNTDVIFNPTLPFSTTLATRSFDIQSTLAHELGHALGLDHSNVAGATMFAQVARESRTLATLTADDMAFAADIYPRPGAEAGFGTIEGSVRLEAGAGVRGALVSAFDPIAHAVIGGITDSDGSYKIGKAPLGNYLLYAEPLDGPARENQLGPAGRQPNLAFQTNFFGGRASPRNLAVVAGETVRADIAVTSGAGTINIEGAGAAPFPAPVRSFVGAVIEAGADYTIAAYGGGLDSPEISEASLSFLGADVRIIEDSFRQDVVMFSDGSRFPRIQFRVVASSDSAAGLVSLMASTETESTILSGGIRVVRPVVPPVFPSEGVVNAASFIEGPLSPGGIFSIFGEHLGPETEQGSVGRLNPITGNLLRMTGGTIVLVNGVPAPLFFARQDQINAQAPFEIDGASTAEIVVSYQLVRGAPSTAPVSATNPAMFTFPDGTSAVALNQDGTLNTAGDPAPRDSIVAVFGTGQGMVEPGIGTGEPGAAAEPLNRVTADVSAMIGGVGSEVLFAGMAPGFVGLTQVNLRIPPEVQPGPQVPVKIDIDGASTQPGLTLAVKE